jgi:hypothetical protein
MRRLTAGLACFGLLWALAGCADPAADGLAAGEAAPTTTTRPGHPTPRRRRSKQRDSRLSGRHVNLAVYYLRTFEGRRYLARMAPVPYTRAWPWPP